MVAKRKIIIIGAGIAGLAACKRLIECGFDAIVLEARHRCGGRIWTEVHSDLTINKGASWIHGIQKNPIALLARQSHTELVVMDFDKFQYYDRQGLAIAQPLIQKFNEKFKTLLQEAKKIAFQAKYDFSLSDALSNCIRENSFSQIEEDIFKAKLLRLEDYNGASSDCLSARHWDDEETWPGNTCYVLSGFESIINHFKKTCVIQFGKIVTKINIGNSYVEVCTENEEYIADAVIVTVPLGVLKNNKFDFNPPLPFEKIDSINLLEMGLLNITAIKFPYVFWPGKNNALRFTQFDNSSISFFFNLHYFNNKPVLIGTHGGERAKRIENLTDTELIEKTMKNFRHVFGSQIPDPVFYLNTRWAHDPFSYGSYSYIPTGASKIDYENIAAPVGNKLFFAGEATCSRYPATMHGAYLSGIREAERIINFS